MSTLLDYFIGFQVNNSNKSKSKLFLYFSIFSNLGILSIFKYYNFFASELNIFFLKFGVNLNPIILNFALPIGISFYTFHGMSYVFDIFRSKQKPIKNIVDYSLFVSFFPLLVAGPIERANHLLPQITNSRFFNYNQSV